MQNREGNPNRLQQKYSTIPTRNRRGTASGKAAKRPQIGYKADPATGKPTKTQARFNFGQDPKEREYGTILVRRLYEENCQETDGEYWSDLTLSSARQIEQGSYEIPFEVPEAVLEDESLSDEDRAAEYVFTFRHQQQVYPSLKLVPAEEELYHRGVLVNRKFESNAVRKLYREQRQEGRVPSHTSIPDKVILGTLHEALESYKKHIEHTGLTLDEGTLNLSQRKRLSSIQTLKEHHGDDPLHEITFDRIAMTSGHWTNRPKTKRKTRYKPIAARHI